MIRVNLERDRALVKNACLRIRTRRHEFYVWRDRWRIRRYRRGPESGVMTDDISRDPALLQEDVADLTRECARLHLLLTEHGIEDPTRAGLTARQKRVLADADRKAAS